MRHCGIWNDELVAEIDKMWNAEGKSAAVISSIVSTMLGFRVTRNSIIGKVDRMGWKRNVSPRERKKYRPRRIAMGRQTQKARLERMPPRKFAPDIPSGSLIPLHDLNSITCRWPYGDPGQDDFGFCGAVCEITDPYCDKHAARASGGWAR